MQYVLIRPGMHYVSAVHRSLLMYIIAVSIAGMICQYYNVLCASGPYSVHFAEVYLESVDFVSIRYIQLTHDSLVLTILLVSRYMV